MERVAQRSVRRSEQEPDSGTANAVAEFEDLARYTTASWAIVLQGYARCGIVRRLVTKRKLEDSGCKTASRACPFTSGTSRMLRSSQRFEKHVSPMEFQSASTRVRLAGPHLLNHLPNLNIHAGSVLHHCAGNPSGYSYGAIVISLYR